MRICLTLALVASTIWGTGCASCCSGKCPFSCLKCCKKSGDTTCAKVGMPAAGAETVQWEKAKSSAAEMAKQIASSPEPEPTAAQGEPVPVTSVSSEPAPPANSTEPGADEGAAFNPAGTEGGPTPAGAGAGAVTPAPPPPPKVGAAVIDGPAPTAAVIAGEVSLHHDDPRLALEREAQALRQAAHAVRDQATATAEAAEEAAHTLVASGKAAAGAVAVAAIAQTRDEIEAAQNHAKNAVRTIEEKADQAVVQAQAVAKQKIAEAGAAAEQAVEAAAGLVPVGALVTPQLPAETDAGDPSLYERQKDYMWVQGKLIRIYSRGGYWQIRYASYDETDSYGGKFVLVGTVPEDVREGDYIRVRGKVLGENKWLTGTEYRIDSVQLVARGQAPFSK